MPYVFENTEELTDFLAQLPRAKVDGKSYTELDRARDFMAVFGDDRGKRVLAQIVDMCSPVTPPSGAGDHGMLAFREGNRYILTQIMRCFAVHKRDVTVERKENDS